jgi:hypothetical protein
MRIWINPLGGLGNRMFQYLSAEGVRQHLPQVIIENVHLQEWGLYAPAPCSSLRALKIGRWFPQYIDPVTVGQYLRSGAIEQVIIDGYVQHLENLPPLNMAKALFPPPADTIAARGFGRSDLVCSVRGSEILYGGHEAYVPLPPRFYAMVAEQTGLDPVFYGQIQDDPYCDALRTAFPNARFIPGTGVMTDFEVLRRSVNIVPSISTYAWLAAWLSDAKSIFLPVCGLFNPVQAPHHLFLPLDDARYRFALFSTTRAVNAFTEPDRFRKSQEESGTGARMVANQELARLHAQVLDRFPKVYSPPPALWLRHQILEGRRRLRLLYQ